MVIRVFFLDGAVKAVFVDSATTISEMKSSVVSKYLPPLFALCLVWEMMILR